MIIILCTINPALSENCRKAGDNEITGSQKMQTAIFAAGCFWGVEAAFRQVDGVISTRVGYTGGNVENPAYQDVCTGQTGHAEAVEIKFDPTRVTYDELLAVFWECHDPTTLNRQGPDFGTQYRSVVFYIDNSQKEAAENSMKMMETGNKYNRPIVTEIIEAGPFYEAEQYHQQYLEKQGKSSCRIK